MGLGYVQDLETTYPCGRTTIRGKLAKKDSQDIAVFTFGTEVSQDFYNAMVQKGGNVIGLKEEGVRRNLKNKHEIVVLLLPGTRMQMAAAANLFRDKVIDWADAHPDGSDTERKRRETERLAAHTAADARRSSTPVPPANFTEA